MLLDCDVYTEPKSAMRGNKQHTKSSAENFTTCKASARAVLLDKCNVQIDGLVNSTTRLQNVTEPKTLKISCHAGGPYYGLKYFEENGSDSPREAGVYSGCGGPKMTQDFPSLTCCCTLPVSWREDRLHLFLSFTWKANQLIPDSSCNLWEIFTNGFKHF
ncbi:hypothetical protein XENOCAPTIV_002080 [Xenoophorus captivus]|uniref:Uncharacterized protein n=1 Tax=Xenoophorus captivus TaxID=1517983 RepID=A0ABV0S6X3_9TELE